VGSLQSKFNFVTDVSSDTFKQHHANLTLNAAWQEREITAADRIHHILQKVRNCSSPAKGRHQTQTLQYYQFDDYRWWHLDRDWQYQSSGWRAPALKAVRHYQTRTQI
jgi:hypothetical protein